MSQRGCGSLVKTECVSDSGAISLVQFEDFFAVGLEATFSADGSSLFLF